MKSIKIFDYAVSNPPYQITEETEFSNNTATNIFQDFYQNALLISKRITMIFPGGRWMQRSSKSNGISNIIFPALTSVEWFPNGKESNISKIFPNVILNDGLSIVIAEKDSIKNDTIFLNDVLISKPCDNEIIPLSKNSPMIIEKIKQTFDKTAGERTLNSSVFKLRSYHSERFPHTVSKNAPETLTEPIKGMIANTSAGSSKRVEEYWIEKDAIKWSEENIKVYLSYKICASDGDTSKMPERANYQIVPKNFVVGESWRIVGIFDTIEEAENYQKYISTPFARYLLAESKGGNNRTWGYFVPDLENYTNKNDKIQWNDYSLNEQLYKIFSLSSEEIENIEKDYGIYTRDKKNAG